MALYTNNLYEENVISIKSYGDNKVKITMLSKCRVSGLEKCEEQHVKKNSVNTEKLSCNLARAKSKVQELALCNDWEYWCTFTISPDKYDRYNLKAYVRDFTEFIHNLNKRREKKIRYLFIPEMHQDGAWHIHGFIMGLSEKDIIANYNGYLTWKQYNDKFGFMSMSKIEDLERCSSYALKYMTKDASKNVSELGNHLYYASQKLNVAERIYKGHGVFHGTWDWEHPDGYCKIKTIDTRYQAIEEFVEVLE